MSRSTKKTPKRGVSSAESEKNNKRLANRKLRRATKVQVNKGENVLTDLREVSDIWAFNKDGKTFIKKPTKKDLRK